MRLKLLLALVLGLWPHLGMAQSAQTAETLRTAIVAAATNEFEAANHTVEINGCEMTTYVWKPYEDQGMKLWSSFSFDMRMTRWTSGADNSVTIAIDDRKNTGAERSLVLIMFKMRGQALARHEVPEFRVNDNKLHRPSPRQGYVPFFFRDAASFFVMHEGKGVVDKALRFTALYEQYVSEYCATLS